MFDAEDAIVRTDMSEFMDKHTAARLSVRAQAMLIRRGWTIDRCCSPTHHVVPFVQELRANVVRFLHWL
jgi:hypothetical protein